MSPVNFACKLSVNDMLEIRFFIHTEEKQVGQFCFEFTFKVERISKQEHSK